MARRNRAGSDAGLITDDPGASGALALDTPAPVLPMTGPHDGDDLDPEITDAAGLVDFGAVRVPVPTGGTVTVEPTANGRMQAVHIALAGGRLSLSALAAPKSSKLWPDLAREIDKSLRDGGARVRSYSGEWGRELHATSGAARSVFVGVDGPRWMLYGVATGPQPQAEALEAELRRMLRGTVVVRGRNPYPVRTVLPLVVPEHLAEQVAAAIETKKAAEELKAAQKAAVEQAAQQSGAQPAQPPAAQQTTAQPAVRQAGAQQAAAQQTTAQPAARQAGAQQTTARQAAAQQTTAQPAASRPVPPAPGPVQPAAPVRTGAQPPVAPAAADDQAPDESLPPTWPLHELPAARRAAAGAWRNSPAVAPLPERNGSAPAPVNRDLDRDIDPPTEVWAAVPPAPPPAETTGRRRLAEPAAAPTGWHQVPPVPGSTGQHPVPRPPQAPSPVPPAVDGTGRRGPVLPAAEATGRRAAVEPARPEGPVSGTGGRRRLEEPPAASGPPAGAPPAGPQATGRRHLAEPPHRTGRHPVPPAAVDPPSSTTGRRRLAEPAHPAAEAPSWAPVAEPGGNGTGRRHLAEPDGSAAPPPWAAGEHGVNGTGQRFAAPGPERTGRRHLADPNRADPNRADPNRADPNRAEPNGAGPGSAGAGNAADERQVEGTGRRHLPEPAAWDGAPDQGTGSWARPLPAPEVSGWIPVVEGTGGHAVEGTGRRRRVEPAASGPPSGTPAGVPGGRRRRPDPEETSGDVLGDAGPPTTRWSLGEDAEAFGTGSGERRRESGVTGTGGWLPQLSGPLSAQPLSAQPLSDGTPAPGESTGRRHLAESPAQTTGGRRRRREPDGGEPNGTGPYAAGSLVTGSGEFRTLQSQAGVESTGRRHRPEPASTSPMAPPNGSPNGSPGSSNGSSNGSAVERTGRRRADDPSHRGTRRTLGAEYLIDTGEQAVWTGGARRYTPPAEPLPGPQAPAGSVPGGAAPAPEPRVRGRHSAHDEEESTAATVRLRALVGEPDPDRPSGRHRRPG